MTDSLSCIAPDGEKLLRDAPSHHHWQSEAGQCACEVRGREGQCVLWRIRDWESQSARPAAVSELPSEPFSLTKDLAAPY